MNNNENTSVSALKVMEEKDIQKVAASQKVAKIFNIPCEVICR